MEFTDTSEDKAKRADLIQELFTSGIRNQAILNAMQAIPRHCFVPAYFQNEAYLNSALPIGEGQTISQPYIVARMTELVFDPSHCQKILEIGTGSGYQAAVLAQLYDEVYTVERIQGLLERATHCFQQLNINNIQSFYQDGYEGYFEGAPYDAVIVTAVASQFPLALLAQLKLGGRMVMPLEHLGRGQFLTLAVKTAHGIELSEYEEVRFVPMLGGLN